VGGERFKGTKEPWGQGGGGWWWGGKSQTVRRGGGKGKEVSPTTKKKRVWAGGQETGIQEEDKMCGKGCGPE